MRIALDTNVLISGAFRLDSPAGLLVQAFLDGRFELVIGEYQLTEFRIVTRYPRVRKILPAARAGFLINQMLRKALIFESETRVTVSIDPDDNEIIAVSLAGKAQYLVSGDKSHALTLKKVGEMRIINVVEAMKLLNL